MTSSHMNSGVAKASHSQLAHREHLSAGIDDELNRDEQRFLLRRFEHDDALQGAWLRYQLIGDSLRQELPVLASAGFAGRVAQTIAAQADLVEVVVPARRSRGGRWLKLSAGTAIAASVAVAALMVARPIDNATAPMTHAAVASVTSDKPASNTAAADAVPASAPAVPTWLSRNNAFAYSQQASATITGPSGSFGSESPYAHSLSPYQMQAQRSAAQPDGSYLLLVDPTRTAMHQRAGQRMAAPAQ